MKKTKKRILLIIAGFLVLLAGIGLFYSYPILSMAPTETGQIPGTNIFAVKNRIGTAFFVKTGNGYILIDAGSDPQKFETSIKEAGIDVNEVRWIFLTHSDADHTAGLTLFPNAQIHMSEDELPLINGTVKRSFFGRNTLPSGIDIGKIILLSDSRELSYNGTNVKCIKAPGHTNGSMVYLFDGKYLFTGDAFKVNKGVMVIHPFTMDARLGKKTMEQLKGTINSCSMILTSHYGSHKKLDY